MGKMIMWLRGCCLILLCFLSMSMLRLAAASVVFDNGISEYVIAILPNASAVEQTAARELQQYVQKMGQIQLPISTAPAPGQKVIRIQQDASLPSDSVSLQSQSDGSLLLSGGAPAGCLYAVYTLLEDYGQVRWWSSEAEQVPTLSSWELPDLSFFYAPPILNRESFFRDVRTNAAFAARMRNNGHFNQLGADFGGHNTILGWCHTFSRLLPPSEFFATHPEYFAEINGKRSLGIDVGQPCLSNPEVKRIISQRARQWLRENPGTRIISISQNDNSDYCRCADCRTLDEREGTPAASVIQFVNQIADDIAAEFPDVLVETLAYTYTQKAPATIRPRDNMIIRLCSFKSNYRLPLSQDPEFSRDIEAWGRISPQVYLWNYIVNFSNFATPHPNIRHFGADLQYLQAHRVTAVFEQGSGGSLGELVPLRLWLSSQLLWKPDADQEALTDEFLNGYYGAAAPYLRQYMNLGYQAVDAAGFDLRLNHDTNSWLPLADLIAMKRLMIQAVNAVAGDPELTKRVKWTEFGVNLGLLARPEAKLENATGSGQALRAEFNLDQLLQDCRAINAAAPDWYREHNGDVNAYLHQLAGQVSGEWNNGKTLPASCVDLVPEGAKWGYFTPGDFRLYAGAKIVDDRETPAAKAAPNPDWGIQWHVPTMPEDDRQWQVYVLMRCDNIAGDDNATWSVGGYQLPGAGAPKKVRVGDFKSLNYIPLHLGTVTMNPGGYYYVTGISDAIHIYVAGFLIVQPQ